MSIFYGTLYHSDMHRIKSLTRAEILVYCSLLALGGKHRKVKKTQQQIASFAGVSIGSVKRALPKFERLQWITSKPYYQIKIYLVTIAEESQSFDLDQDYESTESHLDDIPPAQNPDPHVLTNNNNNNTITCSDKNWTIDSLLKAAQTKDEVIFVRLFQRWSQCKMSNWSTPRNANPLSIYKSKAKATRGLLVHSLELQIIDSWLLMQRADQTGKHWRSASWINGITNWFDRQLKQGSRTNIKRLSKRQKQYFSYCVQEMVVPAAPDYDLTAYIQKQKKQQEDGDEIRRLMNYANHTESCVVAYLKYITEHNKLDVDVDWAKIVEHCKVQFQTLTPDEVDAVERAVPVLRSVHFCIKNNWYIERS